MHSPRFSPNTPSVSPSLATGTQFPGNNGTSFKTDAGDALSALARKAGSLEDFAPSPPAVGRFAALFQHISNFVLSASALGAASLSTIKETYESSTLSTAHQVTLSTATAASLSSLMDLAVAVGKYCNPSSTSAQIQNTAWMASAGKLVGSKHLETYGGKYQTTLLGTSMMLFVNGTGVLAGGHESKQEMDETSTSAPLGLPSPSEAPGTELQHLDTLQNCIGFAALAYRLFGDALTTGVVDWMSAREAKRNMDVVERALNYEEGFGTEGRYRVRDAEWDLEAGEASDDSGMDDRSLKSVSSSVANASDTPLVMNL
ncbi:hypothetical protein PCA20602_04813 [Pandoraea capi]|uniref:Secretion protein EspA n=1 Tax=Pandoraea capi TaxID=2508286 RepID=A0ABY6WCQ8_9BURK|nr:hypothetical protein PCA20602_04813 [Pandoraea capi]